MVEIIAKILSFDVLLLNSDFSKWKYEKIIREQEEVFVILKEMSLFAGALRAHDIPAHLDDATTTAAVVPALLAATVRNAQAAAVRIRAAVSVAVAVADADWVVYDKFYVEAKKEFEETGKIGGYEVYLVNSNKKVWISRFDWDLITTKG